MELQGKIDNYLLDKLNPSEKIEFEELVSKDNLLKNEVELQRSISNALNQSGSIALKARLNSIPVSMASTGNSIVMKWIGAGIAASLLAGFIIFLLPSQEEFQKNNNPITEEQTIVSPNTSVVQESNPTENQSLNTVQETTSKTGMASKNSVKQVVKSTTTTPKLEAYKESADFSDMSNEDIVHVNQASNIPSSNLTSESNKLSNLSVTINSTNTVDKSYQFDGAKLTLFGDFAQHPYELLELNNKGQKVLFLSYQTEFYELVWGKNTKTPLKKVSNKSTIEKLKQINN